MKVKRPLFTISHPVLFLRRINLLPWLKGHNRWSLVASYSIVNSVDLTSITNRSSAAATRPSSPVEAGAKAFTMISKVPRSRADGTPDKTALVESNTNQPGRKPLLEDTCKRLGKVYNHTNFTSILVSKYEKTVKTWPPNGLHSLRKHPSVSVSRRACPLKRHHQRFPWTSEPPGAGPSIDLLEQSVTNNPFRSL